MDGFGGTVKSLAIKPAYKGHMKIKLQHHFIFLSGQLPATYLASSLITAQLRNTKIRKRILKDDLKTVKHSLSLADNTVSYLTHKTPSYNQKILGMFRECPSIEQIWS